MKNKNEIVQAKAWQKFYTNFCLFLEA